MSPLPVSIGPADKLYFEGKPNNALFPWLCTAGGVASLALVLALWLFMSLPVVNIVVSVLLGLPALGVTLLFGGGAIADIGLTYRIYGDRVEAGKGLNVRHSVLFADVGVVAVNKGSGKQQLFLHDRAGKNFVAVWTTGGKDTCPKQIFEHLEKMCFDLVRARLHKEARTDRGAKWFAGLRIRESGLVVEGKTIPFERLTFRQQRKQNRLTVTYGRKDVILETYLTEQNIQVGLEVISELRGQPV